MAVPFAVKIGLVGLLGAILCAVGAIVAAIFPPILKAKIAENLLIKNGTDTFKAWQAPPIPIYMQFYMYNLTNAADVNKPEKDRAKPIFQQLGPYTFREYRKKENISFDQGTVKYIQKKWFVFEEDKTDGSLNDSITTVNLPGMSLALKAEANMTRFNAIMFDSFLKSYKTSPFITKTVDELLFTGYKEHLISDVERKKNITILKNGTFGFLYGQNYTDDGVYVINTGEKGPETQGTIETWNDEIKLNFWNDEFCNGINGSDGSMFPPFVTKDRILRLYSTELCRSISLEYEEEKELHGILLYRFTPPLSVLADRDVNPDNACFCLDENNCLKTGLLNIGVCKKGAPIILSPPHFYQSDPEYLEAVEGLSPNKFEHETILDIEPVTGVVMNAARRMQLNANMQPTKYIPTFKNIPKMIFPLFWLNETAQLDEGRAEKLKLKFRKLDQAKTIGHAVSYGLIAVGILILITIFIYATYVLRQRSKNYPRKFSNKRTSMEAHNLPHLDNGQNMKPLIAAVTSDHQRI